MSTNATRTRSTTGALVIAIIVAVVVTVVAAGGYVVSHRNDSSPRAQGDTNATTKTGANSSHAPEKSSARSGTSAATPEMHVVPYSKLTGGDDVQITGANLPPNTRLWLVECSTGADSNRKNANAWQCDDATEAAVRTDGSGRFGTTFTAQATLSFGDASDADCSGSSTCVVKLTRTGDQHVYGGVPLAFDIETPPPDARLNA